MHAVEFQPVGRRATAPPERSLLDAAVSVGVEVQATCGGIGLCGSCRVRVIAGAVTEAGPDEAKEIGASGLAAGYRLACQAHPRSDMRLEVPPESLVGTQRLQLEAAETPGSVDPCILPCDMALAPPSLTDMRADATRLQDALRGAEGEAVHFGCGVVAEISETLRAEDWRVRVAVRSDGRRRKAVAVLPAGAALVGFAADIGTTKVAMYLLDLATGETLASAGAMNPQISCGEDLISRIAFAGRDREAARELQRRILGCLAEGLTNLCRQAGVETRQVVDAVLVGNTVMHHLLAGFPTDALGVAPYVAAVSDPLDIPARDLGLPMAAGADVHLPPVIAGFVGGDHVAMLLAVEDQLTAGTALALDIGTNTEISLHHKGRIVCCSCPSGPAFEGAHLSAGMRAAPGAIEAVRINGDRVVVRTIGHGPPVGICGSGILDAAAEMLAAGMLDERGNMRKEHPLLEGGVLVLAPASPDGRRGKVAVQRRDVMEIQLAKATIQSATQVLLAHVGITAEALDLVLIAGAFGTYLDVRSGIRLGMFPAIPRERYRQVGNAAGLGARQMLVSAERRRRASALARQVEYLELAAQTGFAQRYLEALWL